jgi:hypothetical protein
MARRTMNENGKKAALPFKFAAVGLKRYGAAIELMMRSM